MTFSFTTRKDNNAALPLQSTATSASKISNYKTAFKNWNSNRMYRTVRYTQTSVPVISRLFAPANLFALAFASFFLFSCSKNHDQPAKPLDAKQQEQKRLEQELPGYNEKNTTAVAWEQLPSELKNAVSVKTLKEAKEGQLGSSLWSTYSYPMGPWGGGGGSPYSIYPPSGSRIYAMAISSGSLVDRIVIWYQTAYGTIYVGGDRGGSGGTYHVQYFSPGEHITGIGGRSGGLIDRLTVYTNKKWFSYGGYGGSPFYASVPWGYQILGFYGGSGIYIDRIGFYVYTW